MQTLIKPKVKLNFTSFDNSTYQVKEKLNNSRFGLESKFYQKLFVIILSSCAFLIFPESPQDAEALCKEYHPSKACIVW
tara:strand:+ start:267 stop:503 length:237 start_codon:yes stop_codon:yes gene_type:complete